MDLDLGKNKAFYESTDVTGETYNPIESQRHTEVATFMRCPHVTNLQDVDIGIIGIPYDGGLTCRTGARHGPRDVRDQSSLMRMLNVVTGAQPFKVARVADLGDVRFRDVFNLDNAINDIERTYDAISDAGVFPIAVGGDHSVTYPILKSLKRHQGEPIALIHVDAHTDTWPEFMGSKFHHGAPFRLAVEDGLIDPKRTIQIGIRGGQNTVHGLSYSRNSGMRVVPIEEFEELGWKAVAELARETVGDRPVYLSFDIDGLDPCHAPGTGTPEAGGITMREAQCMLRALDGLNFIGGDVVEISPPFDPSYLTAFNGATVLYEILCLVASSFSN